MLPYKHILPSRTDITTPYLMLLGARNPDVFNNPNGKSISLEFESFIVVVSFEKINDQA